MCRNARLNDQANSTEVERKEGGTKQDYGRLKTESPFGQSGSSVAKAKIGD